jgi:hypothetical protein
VQGPQGSQGPQGDTGPQGPQGDVGDPGVVIDSTPPTNTDLLWVDTSETGEGLSLGDLADVDEGSGANTDDVLTYDGTFWVPAVPNVYTVLHGSTASTARPDAATVYWKGSVAPDNGLAGDIWYDTTGD